MLFMNQPRVGIWGPLAELGVVLFLILSGFLITGLLLAEEATNGSISLPNFYRRRALRIMPAFYVMLFVIAFLMWRGLVTDVPWRSWLVCAAYLRDFMGRGMTLVHTWSLALEEQFYLLWPWLLIALATPRRRVDFAASGVLGIILYRGVIIGTGRFLPHQHFQPQYWADALLAGCLIALARHYRPALLSAIKSFASAVTLVVSIAIIAWTVTAAAYTSLDPLHRTVQIVLGLVLLVCLITTDESLAAKLFSCQPLRLLGAWSYSLYLWHVVFILVKEPSWGRLREFPFDLICATVAALTSYYAVERPFLRLKQRWEPQNGAKINNP